MKTKLLLITASAFASAAFAWGQTGAAGAGGGSGGAGGASTGVATGTTATDGGAPATAVPPAPTAGSAAAEARMSNPVDAGAASAVPPTATSAGSPMESAVRGTASSTVTGGVDPVLGGTPARSPTGPAPALHTATPGSVPPVSSIQLPAGTVSPGTAPIGPEPLRTTREVLDSLGPTHQQNPAAAGAASRNPQDGRGPDANAAGPQPGAEPDAATSTFVSTPPPPAHRETVTPAESSDDRWVPGYYSWNNGQWTWVAGQWTRPPAPGATWVPGRYDEQTKRWTEPHWNTATANRPSANERAR